MENSALNLAHQQSRRADAHLKAHRFEEAKECHLKAAELILDAMKDTEQPRALESLQLQRQYHLRQNDIIRLRKTQYEKYCRAVESNKAKLRSLHGDHTNPDTPVSNLPVAIYRTMVEADSLIDQLLRDDERETTPVEAPPIVMGSKQPKDDKIVVEELRTVTKHLRELVIQLVNELDESNQQNEALRAQVRLLSSQLDAAQNNSQPRDSEMNMPVKTDPASLPNTSDLSSEVTPTTSRPNSYHSIDRTLPILAPLEMPTFDFSVFQKLDAKPPPDLLQ